MRYSTPVLERMQGRFQHLKRPLVDAPAAQRDPAVIDTVSTMLREIEGKGLDAVRAYSRALDNDDRRDFELAFPITSPRVATVFRGASARPSSWGPSAPWRLPANSVPISSGSRPSCVRGWSRGPATFRWPRVGAYLPAGRFPLNRVPSLHDGGRGEDGRCVHRACLHAAPAARKARR